MEIAVKGCAYLMPKLRAKKRNQVGQEMIDAFKPSSTESR